VGEAVTVGRVRELRARDPRAVARAAARRRRRPLLPGAGGGLMLIAADHPARGALGVRGAPAAMADRTGLLERLVLALSRPGVDGVLGTADVLEDLLLLGALEGKVVIGSMNRGGLAGASFELDDRFTGYDAATHRAVRLRRRQDALPDRPRRPRHGVHLEACARAVTGLSEHGLMAMVEPFMSRRVDGQVRNDLSVEAVVTSVAIASGLGTTSAYSWLKLPVVPGMDAVMAATTLPTLLLGGDPDGDPEETYGQWEKALALPGVRGLVVGGRCSTRRTATSPRPSTWRPGWCTGRRRHDRAGTSLHRPNGTLARDGWACLVDPDTAGWAYSGLRVLELAAGGSRSFDTGPDEMLLLPLSGSATVTCGGRPPRWTAGRPSGVDRPTSPTCRSARP
jgi:hypothetical protein